MENLNENKKKKIPRNFLWKKPLHFPNSSVVHGILTICKAIPFSYLGGTPVSPALLLLHTVGGFFFLSFCAKILVFVMGHFVAVVGRNSQNGYSCEVFLDHMETSYDCRLGSGTQEAPFSSVFPKWEIYLYFNNILMLYIFL